MPNQELRHAKQAIPCEQAEERAILPVQHLQDAPPEHQHHAEPRRLATLMPCFHPLTAWMDPGKKIRFQGRENAGNRLQLPCGRCVGCRLERSRQWAVRCMHEAQLHEHNCFITLTYNETWQQPGLNPEDFTKFMKRLRRPLPPQSVSYYMCGEYTPINSWPHFHACIFGYDFNDKRKFKKATNGAWLYTSPTLEKLWPFGYSTIGDVTFESAAYVARYVMKKMTGEKAKKHYERIDATTGELITVHPEYSRMSLRPAIGKNWITKYKDDVYPHDHVVTNGHAAKPPRYYDNVLAKESPAAHLALKEHRKKKALSMKEDNTKDRLEVKEAVTKARLNLKNRHLE